MEQQEITKEELTIQFYSEVFLMQEGFWFSFSMKSALQQKKLHPRQDSY